MANLSEIIVYIWLLPVAAQILLPLGIFAVSMVFKGYKAVFSKSEAVPAKAAMQAVK